MTQMHTVFSSIYKASKRHQTQSSGGVLSTICMLGIPSTQVLGILEFMESRTGQEM